MRLFVLSLLLISNIHQLFALSTTWTNGNSTNLWNDPLNWTAGVPNAGDDAFFDATSTANCLINVPININTLTLQNAYTGQLSQNSGNALVLNNMTLNGGSFLGSDADITVGTFYNDGCAFTASSTKFILNRDYTLTGTATFSANNGTFSIRGGSKTIMATQDLHNLSFSNTTHAITTIIGTLSVNNNLNIIGTLNTVINTGTIKSHGDILIANTGTGCGGTALILIAGTGDQNITSTVGITRGELPNVEINKTSGTAIFNGIFSVFGDWTYTAGLTDYNTNTATIAFTNRDHNIYGNNVFGGLRFHLATHSSVTLHGKIEVDRIFTTSNYLNTLINNDTILVTGDLLVANTGTGCGGDALILIEGTGDQNIMSNVGITQGELPNVEINKPSGTATFSGMLSIFGDWTYTAGLTDYNTNTATIAFTHRNHDIWGEHVFGGLRFHLDGHSSVTLHDKIEVDRIFTTSNYLNTLINNDTILVTGDLLVANTGTGCGGDALILIEGTGDQNIMSNVGITQGELPNVEINKPSGTATFSGMLSIFGDWTYTAGLTDYNTNTATIAFTHRNHDIWGEHVFGGLRFHLDGHSSVTLHDKIEVDRIFTTSNYLNTLINNDTILVTGDLLVANTGTGCGGDALILIEGTGDQNIMSNVGITQGELPNVEINKPSGTATFSGMLSIFGDWTYTAGLTDYNTNTATIAFTHRNHDIWGEHVFGGLRFHLDGHSSVTLHDKIEVDRIFTTSNYLNTLINNDTILVTGDLLVANTGTGCGGDALILIEGTGDQNIMSNVGITQGELPNVEINKPSGTATFTGILSLVGDWTYTAGLTDYNTNTATIAFTNREHNIYGNNIFGGLRFHLGSHSYINLHDKIEVDRIFTISNYLITTINLDTLQVTGDALIANTANGGGGTATIEIAGNNNQTINHSSAAFLGRLPNIYINKTAGLATLDGAFTITGHWDFEQGNIDALSNTTRVIMVGNNKRVDGEGNGQTMRFYDLSFQHNNTYNYTLTGDVHVENLFILNRSRTYLNSNRLTIENSDSAAIVRTTGRIISESTDNQGILRWNIGTDAKPHIFPFANSSLTNIPFHFQTTDGGDVGYVSLATYPTPSNNTPYPVWPEPVLHTDGINGGDNSSFTIDRFWQIDKDGPSGTADIQFTYAQADVSAGVAGRENDLVAQRYSTTNDNWDLPLAGQLPNAAANTVSVSNVNQFSPWTLALNTDLLPVELLDFSAKLNNNNVEVFWQTSTEINSDYFIVERSADGLTWEEVEWVQAAGNSTELLNYQIIDEAPLVGNSYYRLKQVDLDASINYSKIAVVYLDRAATTTISPNPANDYINITYTNSSNQVEAVDMKLYDLGGRLVWQQPIEFSVGAQIKTLYLNNQLASGVYYLHLGYHVEKLVIQK